MQGVWRILRRVGAGVAALAVVLGSFAYMFVSGSLPTYQAAYVVPGPIAEIEVIRDERAIPHVFAKTEADAYFGLGFVHAQDRLWQMEFRRRITQGRLTELFRSSMLGRYAVDAMDARETLLRFDATMRALDLDGHAARAWDGQTPATKAALEAYAAGVNAWLQVVDEKALGRGAPELQLLLARVAPWRPEDSLAAFKLLAATLSAAPFAELRLARFVIGQGPERAADLFPDAHGAPVVALPAYADLFGRETEFAEALGPSDPFDPFGGDAAEFTGASNAWAVSGPRAAARAPLLAADPHLPLSAPSIWHMARLEFGDGGVIGGGMPGIPAILIGRNESIAWGATTIDVDGADIFLERLDPADPDKYLTPEGTRAFETWEETIPIGGGEAVQATLRRSINGPVLPLGWSSLARVTPKGHVPALSWTVLSDEDRSLEGALRLMRARSVFEAADLAELVRAPAQMIMIADRREIAAFSVGAAPLRRGDSLTRGRTPSPGWRVENAWVGVTPLERMPQVVSPRSGVLANANNKITDAPFPFHLGHDWPEPYRIQRLSKLLNNREFHTLNGFKAIQNDTVSEMARAVLPLLAAPLWDGLDRETGLRREALTRLAEWNGEMDAFLVEPLIFTAWARAATRRLAADELEELASDYEGVRPLFLERVLRDVDGAAARWCDDVGTPDEESCAEIVSLALDDALVELDAAYGGRVENWRWGRAHAAAHTHQPFGSSWLGAVLNITQESGGGDHTILRGLSTGRGETPYRNVHAGGLRVIYDFADLDRSVFAMATGQSGHFLSRHYDDLAETWRAGEYRPLSLARRDAESGSVGVTRLIPRAASEDGAQVSQTTR